MHPEQSSTAHRCSINISTVALCPLVFRTSVIRVPVAMSQFRRTSCSHVELFSTGFALKTRVGTPSDTFPTNRVLAHIIGERRTALKSLVTTKVASEEVTNPRSWAIDGSGTLSTQMKLICTLGVKWSPGTQYRAVPSRVVGSISKFSQPAPTHVAVCSYKIVSRLVSHFLALLRRTPSFRSTQNDILSENCCPGRFTKPLMIQKLPGAENIHPIRLRPSPCAFESGSKTRTRITRDELLPYTATLSSVATMSSLRVAKCTLRTAATHVSLPSTVHTTDSRVPDPILCGTQYSTTSTRVALLIPHTTTHRSLISPPPQHVFS